MRKIGGKNHVALSLWQIIRLPWQSRPVPTARRRRSIKLRFAPSLAIRIALSTGVGSAGINMRPSKTDRDRLPH